MATKDLICDGRYIYISSEKGCSIANLNGGGSYRIPAGSYRLKQTELSQHQKGNILKIEYDSSDSSFDASACDFELINNSIGDSTLLKHISDLLDAYIGPKITTDLGSLTASFDGSRILVSIPDDSVYFKGKVDSDIVFDYNNISFDSSGKCVDAPLLTFISYVSIMSIYTFRLNDGVSFSFPVVFMDSKGRIYDVSLSSGEVSSYSFSGSVAASSAASKCLVNDSTLSDMGLPSVRPSNLLAGSFVGSDFVISKNSDCPVKNDASYFCYKNGENGCVFVTGSTDLKCTFHISFDFESK